MVASHNIPARGHNSGLWWSVLAELLDSFIPTTTEKDEGTLHPYTLPTGLAAYIRRMDK